MQYRRPEQRVKVHDVLADEVIELGVVSGAPVFVKAQVIALVTEVQETRGISDRGIQPDIEILVLGAGDLKTKVGSVARDIPVLQACFEPLLELCNHTFF